MKTPPVLKSIESDQDEPIDKFGEILAVMDIEQLIRFRKRLEMAGRKKMVEILTFEIKAREAQERQKEALARQMLDELRAIEALKGAQQA